MSNDTTTPKNTFSYEVPKQLKNIDIEHEKFNSTELSGAAGRLDSAFSQFASILQAANDLVNEHVNASCDECVFGSYGNQLLEMWNSNVPTFNEFKTNFESWSRAVSVISTRNENTEKIANAIYNNRTTGADLTTAGGQTVSEIREDIILKAADEFGGTNSRDGKTYKYYDENGKLITRYENADGEVWMQHTSDNNDRLVSTVCTDKDENTSKIEFVRDENGKVIDKKVTFYDKDGNELETPPETFNENGYLSNGTPKTEPVQAAEPIQATEPIQDTEPVQNTEPVQATEPDSKGSSEYFIQRGDECTVHGQRVSFFARDGSYNYYKDANGNILFDADGALRSLGVHESMFNTNWLKNPNEVYSAVSTTSDGASSMNLPTDVLSSNTGYDPYGVDEYVDPQTFASENVRTYDTNEGFSQDLKSGENLPKILEFDHTLESSSWDIVQPDLSPASNGKVTLVYDERAGMYYQLDDNGTYVRDMYGFTPEELAKFDIEKHK